MDNTWKLLRGGPTGSWIADSTAKITPDGKVLLLTSYQSSGWIYDPNWDTWTAISPKLGIPTGAWLQSAEESYVQLPDGSFLTVDLWGGPASQKYLPWL